MESVSEKGLSRITRAIRNEDQLGRRHLSIIGDVKRRSPYGSGRTNLVDDSEGLPGLAEKVREALGLDLTRSNFLVCSGWCGRSYDQH